MRKRKAILGLGLEKERCEILVAVDVALTVALWKSERSSRSSASEIVSGRLRGSICGAKKRKIRDRDANRAREYIYGDEENMEILLFYSKSQRLEDLVLIFRTMKTHRKKKLIPVVGG